MVLPFPDRPVIKTGKNNPDNKIDFKLLAIECELNFDSDITTALDRATKMCNKFRDNNYVVVINRRREKLMLELLFIRKDIYAS